MGGFVSCCHRLPTVGEINGGYFMTLKEINDPIFGQSTANFEVMEFEIKDHPRVFKSAKLVKELIFHDYPDFTLNELYGMAKVDKLTHQSDYPNPTSHWYNVYYGFYEIDLPLSTAPAAFGFDREGNINPTDIIKLGIADYSFLTAYNYGVPIEICKQHIKPTGQEEFRIIKENVKIGTFTYTLIEISNAMLLSVYPAREKLTSNEYPTSNLLHKMWGTHGYVPGFETPYPLVRMKARLYVTYSIGHDADYNGPCYKTLIAGGIVNMDYPDQAFADAFLEKQLEAVRESILINEQAD